MYRKGLYWVRNDQRLDDNETLNSLCLSAESAVFVMFETPSMRRSGKFRRSFIDSSIKDFGKRLRERGHRLFVVGSTVLSLTIDFFKHNQIDALFFSEEPSWEEMCEEQHMHALAAQLGIPVFRFQQDTLIKIKDLPFSINELPRPFTNYRKMVEMNLKITPPAESPVVWPKPFELKTPSIEEHVLLDTTPTTVFLGGETQAQKNWHHYFYETPSASSYKDTRNGMLRWEDSTKFSPWLSVGNVSVRRLYFELQKYEQRNRANDSTYWILFEFLWRDYFRLYSRLKKEKIFGPHKKYIYQIEPNSDFSKWCLGETGNRFIDANMRELLLTGWMSNRGRQNVASFLAKNLKCPWYWGAQWFEKMLVDYDAANNWGNWIYFSGKDLDPRNRAFNTETQAKSYDPNGDYQNTWMSKDLSQMLSLPQTLSL